VSEVPAGQYVAPPEFLSSPRHGPDKKYGRNSNFTSTFQQGWKIEIENNNRTEMIAEFLFLK